MKPIVCLLSAMTLLLSWSCEKYLNEKSDKQLVVPNTLEDVQSILDNPSRNVTRDAGAGEVSSTDYYLTDADFNSLRSDSEKRMYTWQNDYLFEPSSNIWLYLYTSIYSANSAIESLDRIERTITNQDVWNDIKGQSLYLRARSYLQLAFIFSVAYDEETADSDLGLPLRLNTDFNEQSNRSTLGETYNQIVTDLKNAVTLLPLETQQPVRPSKAAAYGLLARTFLSMREYSESGEYADSCLQIFDKFIDYNTLSATSNYPIPQFNEETICYSAISAPSAINPTRANITPDLYELYEDDDLRKILYFTLRNDQSISYRGSYTGTIAPFGGISSDEVLLTRAECYAREGDVEKAMSDLNYLLNRRYRKVDEISSFVPQEPSSGGEALNLILLERRKELLMRGLRWMDIKRLNKEGRNITLSRSVNGQSYILPPNDLRYALPIPEDIISFSGIVQNPR